MYNQDNTERPTIDLNQWENQYAGRPNWPDRPYSQERPLGVTLIAIWQFIGAAFSVLLLLIGFSIASSSTYSSGTVISALGCLALVIVPLDIAIGVGLWRMSSWARKTTIVLSILNVTLTICSRSITGGDVVAVVLHVASIIYLFQPNIRDLFEPRHIYES